MNLLEPDKLNLTVTQGNNREFILLLVVILSLSNKHQTVIEIQLHPDWNPQLKCWNSLEGDLYEFVKTLLEFYQPHAKNDREPSDFFVLEKNYPPYFEDFFPTARERINAKTWFIETLEKRNIPTNTIKQYL